MGFTHLILTTSSWDRHKDTEAHRGQGTHPGLRSRQAAPPGFKPSFCHASSHPWSTLPDHLYGLPTSFASVQSTRQYYSEVKVMGMGLVGQHQGLALALASSIIQGTFSISLNFGKLRSGDDNIWLLKFLWDHSTQWENETVHTAHSSQGLLGHEQERLLRMVLKAYSLDHALLPCSGQTETQTD